AVLHELAVAGVQVAVVHPELQVGGGQGHDLRLEAPDGGPTGVFHCGSRRVVGGKDGHLHVGGAVVERRQVDLQAVVQPAGLHAHFYRAHLLGAVGVDEVLSAGGLAVVASGLPAMGQLDVAVDVVGEVPGRHYRGGGVGEVLA